MEGIKEKLFQILSGGVISIEYRPSNQPDKYYRFIINFIDWEIQNHKNKRGSTLTNYDYWMPILRNQISQDIISDWQDSNYTTIWIPIDEWRDHQLNEIL